MDNDYFDMAEALMTAMRVAKTQGMEDTFLAKVLGQTVRRTMHVEDFYDIVRDTALDMDLIEDEE